MYTTKISIPVVVIFLIIALSTYSVARTTEIRKRQLPLPLKPILLSQLQTQSGKPLGKTASGINGPKAPDSTEMYNWEDGEWIKYGCFRFSYDSKDRITTMSLSMDDGFGEQIVYEYDPDGITMRQLTVFNWGLGGELFDPDTMYSVIKYYPGYAHSMGLINSDITIYDVATVFKTFNNLDSIISFDYELNDEETFDTLNRFSTRYTKTGNKSVRANIQTYSDVTPGKMMSYSADYVNSGNDLLDTLKCIQHISADMDSEYAAMLTEVQFMMYTTLKNQQGKIVEQTTMTGTDSNFTDFSELSKVNVYYNLSGEIDSCVSLIYDKELKVWKNSEKVIYSYKKVIADVQKSVNDIHAPPQVSIKKKYGTMYLNITDGMTVSTLEQLDIRGRVLSRTVVPSTKNSFALCTVLKKSSAVNVVRVKTNKGIFTCKMSSVK